MTKDTHYVKDITLPDWQVAQHYMTVTKEMKELWIPPAFRWLEKQGYKQIDSIPVSKQPEELDDSVDIKPMS